MPILLTALASVGIAWLRGAPPTMLAGVRLRWKLLPALAFLVQLVVFVRLPDAFSAVAPSLHLTTLALLVIFLAANVRYRGLLVVGVGLLLNVAVIAANGGYMPVRPTDLARAGFPAVAARLAQGQTYQKSVALDDSTRFPYLADVLPLPLPGPDRLLSLGDVFVAAGTFLFLQEALTPVRRRLPQVPPHAVP
ncbi:MAG TPA: DUF5317 domain-containing protein [Chloroflexota bacterium]|nr:DUF5317 domain-containing protein [Chloroflexota bacterium]